MDWTSLACTYLKFNKEELVNRWSQMSHYLEPVNDVDVEFDHGQQKITIYKISKGSLFYHGSTVQIKDFDRIAFFSPHREISKTILSLMAKKFITRPITSQKAYLYTLRAKKDLYIVYNKNMGIGPGYAGQYSPFFKDQPIPEFCEMYRWLDGFYDFRDAAPLFPVFALNIHKNKAELESEIGRLNRDSHFISNYLKYGSDERNDPVYTAEFIFCRPNDSLEVIETEELNSRIMLDYWMDTSKKWLQEMMHVPLSERDTWSMVKKYEFAVGPKFPVIENIYNRRYFVFQNCIHTFDDIPTIINQKTSKFFVTDIDFSDKKIIDFWVNIFSKCLVINFKTHVDNIIKNILPDILAQKPRAGLELMLWLCLYVKAQNTTNTFFNNFRKELLALL